jgi:hypothetical protein
MTSTTFTGRLSSALGQHLVAVLVVLILVVTALSSLPAVMSDTTATAGRAQERANLTLAVAAELDTP